MWCAEGQRGWGRVLSSLALSQATFFPMFCPSLPQGLCMPGPLALPPPEVRLIHTSFRAQYRHSLLGEVFLDPCPAHMCASVCLVTQIQRQPQSLCPQRSLLSGLVESHYNTLHAHIPLTYIYITHTYTTHIPHSHSELRGNLRLFAGAAYKLNEEVQAYQPESVIAHAQPGLS